MRGSSLLSKPAESYFSGQTYFWSSYISEGGRHFCAEHSTNALLGQRLCDTELGRGMDGSAVPAGKNKSPEKSKRQRTWHKFFLAILVITHF